MSARQPNPSRQGSGEYELVRNPTLSEFLWLWIRIGFLSFGGPAAQISLLHNEIVDQRKWLSEKQFLDALGFCMLLPGPEAMQMATFAGWKIRGTCGGLVSGLFFVLPGALVILALSAAYVVFGDIPLVEAGFVGIKSTVIVIVIVAFLKISRRVLHRLEYRVLAGCSFAGIFFLDLPFPLIILAAAAYGLIRRTGHRETREFPTHQASLSSTIRTVVIWFVIWWTPLCILWISNQHELLIDLGIFFSKLAVVTFGGAYAVLSYLAQDIVNQHGWLSASQMMDGLGLAETTPGPLILVTEFAGFVAAYSGGGFFAGLAGAAIALWATFAPCFLWIFAGAPWIDQIGSMERLNGAMSAITAAVAGVILNLSIWFALHVWFDSVAAVNRGVFVLWQPEWQSLNLHACVLTLMSGVLMLRFRLGLASVLPVSCLAGIALSHI